MLSVTGQRSFRPLISAAIIALAVGVLPLSTLLCHAQELSPDAAAIQQAPPASPDSTPSEDPVPGPVWAGPAELLGLWPLSVEQPRPHSTPLRHAGHVRRIDRPPTV
ncbi:MAG: hypothetical protein ABI333_19690 [bacterium]